jgi:hypothetical protein
MGRIRVFSLDLSDLNVVFSSVLTYISCVCALSHMHFPVELLVICNIFLSVSQQDHVLDDQRHQAYIYTQPILFVCEINSKQISIELTKICVMLFKKILIESIANILSRE